MRQKVNKSVNSSYKSIIPNGKLSFVNNLSTKQLNFYKDSAVERLKEHGLDNDSPVSTQEHSVLYVFAETAISYLMKLCFLGFAIFFLLNIVNLFIQPENFLTFLAFSIKFYVFIWVLSFSIKASLILTGLTLFWNVKKYKRDDEVISYLAENIKQTLNKNNAAFLDNAKTQLRDSSVQIFVETDENLSKSYSILVKDEESGSEKLVPLELEDDNAIKSALFVKKDKVNHQHMDRTFTEIFEK